MDNDTRIVFNEAKYYCEECKCEKHALDSGICKRDHPDKLKKQIGDNEYLNITGKTVPFSKIDAHSQNERIVFSAKVISTSDILNYDIQRTYRCPKCQYDRQISCTEFREFNIEKVHCDQCNEAFMYQDKKLTITGNLRKVILQETMDEMNVNPRRIEAEVMSDFVYDLNAGKDYKFEADVWSRAIKGNNNVNKFVLNVTRLRCLDEDTNIMPTDTEVELFKKMDLNKVVTSLAPHIKYRTKEKLAILLCMLSGGRADNIRGDFSTMFIGDPSTGKSQIINASVELDNRSQKVSGRSASAAGLVMGVDNLSDGTRMATFGPVILCHEHHVAIDEGDKMHPNDRSALHDVMEDQKAYLNKVGINLTVNAATKIIMACNPKSSRYEKDGTIKSNIGMPDSFLARFGYIFLMLDNFTREQERESIRHINRIKRDGLDTVIVEDKLLTHEELVKYYNYARKVKPKMTENATSKLEDMYIKLKYLNQKEGSLNIDKRSYHDIIRAAYSFAKIRFSDVVEIEDINNAWELKLYALESFGMKTQGDFNQSMFADSQGEKRKKYITQACIDAKNDEGMIVVEKLIIQLEQNRKMCNGLQAAKDIIQTLINGGTLLNTGTDGVYKYAD